MKMEAEIISKELIKPSSPTPSDNKTYTLSLLDQIVPPIYAPLVLYFPNTTCNNNSSSTPDSITQSLKLSLSTTLSHFPSFAGRVKDSLNIDCNDEGLVFVVAKFSYRLSELLKSPDPTATRAHIPVPLTWAEPGPGSHAAMIQLNHFDCGGVAIGALFLHKLVDGVSMATFMRSWAAAASVSGEIVLPDYSAKRLFPNNESMQRESHIFSAMKKYFGFGKTVMRRYVFDAASISKLRAKLSESSSECSEPQRRPTRVETVTAFMWKCFMAASAAAGSDRATSLVTHNVNIRRKAEPSLAENSFGNYVWLASASSGNEESNRDMSRLFGKVRDALSRVDSEFVRRMQGDMGFAGYCTNFDESWKEYVENADYLAISSWCNFGFYELDFGWGKPVWISKCDGGSDVEWPFINVLWLVDTRMEGGMEVCLTLEERYFVEFDKIEEVRQFALVDPSPLEIGGGDIDKLPHLISNCIIKS